MKNFALISSPLQALVFWIIYNSHSNLNEIKFTIFIEDGYMLPSHPNLKIIYIPVSYTHLTLPTNREV